MNRSESELALTTKVPELPPALVKILNGELVGTCPSAVFNGLPVTEPNDNGLEEILE